MWNLSPLTTIWYCFFCSTVFQNFFFLTDKVLKSSNLIFSLSKKYSNKPRENYFYEYIFFLCCNWLNIHLIWNILCLLPSTSQTKRLTDRQYSSLHLHLRSSRWHSLSTQPLRLVQLDEGLFAGFFVHKQYYQE